MIYRTASIATNDPQNDPTPRVRLHSEKHGNVVVWLDTDGNIVASGPTAGHAIEELQWVYVDKVWDLRFGR